MIKLLLQHVIFEVCLYQLFNRLDTNFGWIRWNANIHKIQSVGDCIQMRVNGRLKETILRKCVVESKSKNKMIIRCEDHPRHIWLEVTDGIITNIYGDEKVIIDIFID